MQITRKHIRALSLIRDCTGFQLAQVAAMLKYHILFRYLSRFHTVHIRHRQLSKSPRDESQLVHLVSSHIKPKSAISTRSEIATETVSTQMSISRFSTPTKTRSEVNLDEPPAKSNSNEDHDHPLLLELSSLRTSLRKFQHVSHSSSMQLQSKMMESLLCQDENVRLKRELEAAKSELDGLR